MGSSTAAAGVATKAVTGQLVGTVTMEATASGLTTGTLGSFAVTPGPAADIVVTGSTTNLASGSTRLLTATLKDAAGNTVTSDNSTVVAFAQSGGLGTVTGPRERDRLERRRHQDRDRRPRRHRQPPGHLRRSHHRDDQLRRHPWSGVPDRADRLDLESHLGLEPRPDRDDQGCRRQHGHRDNTTVVAFAKSAGTGSISGAGSDTATAGVVTYPSPARSPAP